MPCLCALSGHQRPWYWLCRIGKLFSYLRKDYNCLCHVSMGNDLTCKYSYLFHLINLAHKGLILCVVTTVLTWHIPLNISKTSKPDTRCFWVSSSFHSKGYSPSSGCFNIQSNNNHDKGLSIFFFEKNWHHYLWIFVNMLISSLNLHNVLWSSVIPTRNQC